MVSRVGMDLQQKIDINIGIPSVDNRAKGP